MWVVDKSLRKDDRKSENDAIANSAKVDSKWGPLKSDMWCQKMEKLEDFAEWWIMEAAI